MDESAGRGSEKAPKTRKSIFISYSTQSSFSERKFVIDTISSLKCKGLSRDIWFDIDDCDAAGPRWFITRIKAAEKAKAAVLFISDSYFSDNSISLAESRLISQRQKTAAGALPVFLIIYRLPTGLSKEELGYVLKAKTFDLSRELSSKMTSEKASLAAGALHAELKRLPFLRSVSATAAGESGVEMQFRHHYRGTKISQWSVSDVISWLADMDVPECYRMKFFEKGVSGQLLTLLTEENMAQIVSVDSRGVRRKIVLKIAEIRAAELASENCWYSRLHSHRPRPNRIYLVHDPADMPVVRTLHKDLASKCIHVLHPSNSETSKDELLMLNGPHIAMSSFVIVLLTTASVNSKSMREEILFSAWLGKRILTIMFDNVWCQLRPSLKCILGDRLAVDFQSHLYSDSLDTLVYYLRSAAMTGIVLEQTYVTKVSESLQTLEELASRTTGFVKETGLSRPTLGPIFISYQLDARLIVEDIQRHLVAAGFACSLDSTFSVRSRDVPGSATATSRRRPPSRCGTMPEIQLSITADGDQDLRQSAAIIACISPKYLQSFPCVRDLTLASVLRRPVVPVMLSFSMWPPDGTPVAVRRILARHVPVDLSNDKIYERNLRQLVDRVRKVVV